jgi:DNA-binding PadR family transcriptional regulator
MNSATTECRSESNHSAIYGAFVLIGLTYRPQHKRPTESHRESERGNMIHSFDTDIAKAYGINAAVLLGYIAYWTKVNEANDRNYYDGCYWTYNSRKAFAELFPYLSERQIRTAIDKLIDDGLIITGVYNEMRYDHTIWYALTEKGKEIAKYHDTEQTSTIGAKMSNRICKNVKSIQQKCQIDDAEMSNRYCENVKPIPVNNQLYNQLNTNNKGDKPKRFTPPTLEEVKEYCIERKNNVDAQRFIDYYSSNGWKVGRNSMKDWKAAVRTWEKNSYSKPKEEKKDTSYDLNEWEKLAMKGV